MRFFSCLGKCSAGHQWEEFHYLADFDYGGFGLLTELEKIPGYINVVSDEDFEAVKQILGGIPAFLSLNPDEQSRALQFVFGVVFDRGLDGSPYRIDKPRCRVCREPAVEVKYNEDRFLDDIVVPTRNTWIGLSVSQRQDLVRDDFDEYLRRIHSRE